MEYLDILDTTGNKTGEAKSYEEAHEKGLIHRAVHIWILHSKEGLLIQKREKTRRAYPGYWDISASGHVSAGETSLEAAQRETEEELGIKLQISDFKYLFSQTEQLILNDGTYINNEFQDVYIVKKDIPISELSFKDGEVETVRYVSLEEFKKLLHDKAERIIPHREEHQKLIEYISTMELV